MNRNVSVGGNYKNFKSEGTKCPHAKKITYSSFSELAEEYFCDEIGEKCDYSSNMLDCPKNPKSKLENISSQ